MNLKNETLVEIFTDGACKGNPGPGGYGAILKHGDNVKELAGYDPDTTNNRMELTAIIESLRLIKRPCRIRIITDSNYVVKGMTEWLPAWMRKNWKNSQDKPVLNRDLWEELVKLSKPHSIEWKWIKGHDGHKENERCDALARKSIKNNMQK